ncbi:MAG: hypothetical protein FWC89_08320 [Defluviitaleaceae bacterium]|nr:hypothetical protein [Defluviitaleaceae bacterium]
MNNETTRTIRCPRCKELYHVVYPPRQYCPPCEEKREEQIQNVRDMIRENKGINAIELERLTGVPINFIMKIMREGEIGIIRQ